MVTVQPDLIHDAYVEPTSPAALRALPAPADPGPADETVWVSPGVAGYHTSAHCSALLGDLVLRGGEQPPPIRTDRRRAEERGMAMCKWCRAWQQML